MGDVEPLEKRQRLTPTKTPRAAPPRESGRDSPAEFHFPVSDEPLLGHRPGLRRSELNRLRSGKLRPEAIIDLHGHDRSSGHEALSAGLLNAAHRSQRCVLIVHGRGRGSPGGEAVLKSALPLWLAEPSLQDLVLAFAPAQPGDGGPGATYVLLR